MKKELKAKQDNSAIAKLVAKIIDNFQLRVNHVHIRFEDHSYLFSAITKVDLVPATTSLLE